MSLEERRQRQREHQRRYRERNPEKKRESRRLWYLRHKEKHRALIRAGHLRRKYGISIEAFERMLKDQGSGCAVCHTPFVGFPSVDHCHNSGRVRAILCHGCNTALGFAKDDPEILLALASYAMKHRDNAELLG
jgi:hypothetical protein